MADGRFHLLPGRAIDLGAATAVDVHVDEPGAINMSPRSTASRSVGPLPRPTLARTEPSSMSRMHPSSRSSTRGWPIAAAASTKSPSRRL